jgi:hypothetical protein
VNWHRGSGGFGSVRRPIEDMAKVLWDGAERSLTMILEKAPIENLLFEEFDQILKTGTGFVQFGATIVDVPGEQVSGAMSSITTRYFKLFHKGSIDSGRQSLETDNWSAVQLPGDFEKSIMTLQILVKEVSDSPVGIMLRTINLQSAFSVDISKMTESAVTILRLLHQYLTMMKAVPGLARETFQGIQERVEFYSFSVCNLFLMSAPVRAKLIETGAHGKISFVQQNMSLLSAEGTQCIARTGIVHHVQELQIVLPHSSCFNSPIQAVAQCAAPCED